MPKSKIVGIIADTDGSPVTGRLTVKLNAPLIDTATTPDTVHYPKVDVYEITAGNLGVNVKQNDIVITTGINLLRNDEVTYNFSFVYDVEILVLYLGIVEYKGAYHKHTDNKYYTGEVHTAESVLLIDFLRKVEVSLFDPFDAHVLSTYGTEVEWSALQPSSINYSNIDSSIYYIAQLITQTTALLQSLVTGIYNPRGNFATSNTYNKGDVVYSPGTKGSYWYINAAPSLGSAAPLPVPPTTSNANWQQLIEATEVTGGSVDFAPVFMNDVYGATWNGVTNKAPNADVLYDKIQTLATLADSTFAILKAPTLAAGNNSVNVATTAFVQAALTAYSPPSQTTAPNIPLGDTTTKILNAGTYKAMSLRMVIAEERQPLGSPGGTVTGNFKNRNMNTLVTTVPTQADSGCNGLTGGYVQMVAGKYWIEGYSVMCEPNNHRVVLIDSTGAFLKLGVSQYSDNEGYQQVYRGNDEATVRGYLELFATTNLTLRHYVGNTRDANTSGKPSSFAGAEIYAQLCIFKLD